MNRYLSSFALSSAIYVTVVATLFYFINNHSCEAQSKIDAEKVVKISLLHFQKEGKKQEEPKKELEISKPKQEAIAKVEPKKIIKKVPIPLMSHTKSIENIASKETIKEEIKQEIKETQIQAIQTQNSQEKLKKEELAHDQLQERQKSFFLELRELINKNKSYPNSARRRGVQGDVEMRFCILENGNVDNIELISGKSIFKNSAQEAIEKSFPMKVDKTLFSFPKEFKITLAYVLMP